jgi:hypothetical protein
MPLALFATVRVNLAVGRRFHAGPREEAMHLESQGTRPPGCPTARRLAAGSPGAGSLAANSPEAGSLAAGNPAAGRPAARSVAARASEVAVVGVITFVLALFLPLTRAAADRDTRADVTAHASPTEVLSPVLWDSLAALRRTLGIEAGPESDGACLRDEQDTEFYIQNEGFWTEHHCARTIAIEDPAAWDETELGPDLLLPDGAQLLRTALFVLGPGGALQSVGDEARRLDPAEESPCGTAPARLRLHFPALQPHTLLRWEVDWREPTATAHATHWFGGNHPVLESRFSFSFPKAYLDTDWGQFVRGGPGTGAAVGTIPVPVVEHEVGPLKGDRRYTYRARCVAPSPKYPFCAPIAERVPHLSFLPERGGPESRADLLVLFNRMESAAALDAATRESLLAPIIAQTARSADRARLLHGTLLSRVRISPWSQQARDGMVRSAPDTWSTGCGTAADIAALLVAGLREFNLPARPLLARSRAEGAPDTTASDPSEFDRVLVEVGPAEAEATAEATGQTMGEETILDPSCPRCPWGYLHADLQGLPAVGMDHGAPRWRLLPSFPTETNWMRRTVVMVPSESETTMETPAGNRSDENAPPPFTVTVERIAFGEPALRTREAGGMTAPGGEVLPSRPVLDDKAPSTRPMARHARSEDLSSPFPGAGDLEGPVTARDTLRLEAERADDGWRLPESFLGHRGLLPGGEENPPDIRLQSPIVLPHTLVLVDSTVIVLPEGWTAASLPEPSMVQGVGFHFTTHARLDEGRVIVIGLLALEETRFAGARARDLVELASSIRAKDARGILLRKNH